MQRLRSIDKAYDYIKEQDTETALSRYLFRQLVTQGKIPCISAGNRKYVDIDSLEQNIEAALNEGASVL